MLGQLAQANGELLWDHPEFEIDQSCNRFRMAGREETKFKDILRNGLDDNEHFQKVVQGIDLNQIRGLGFDATCSLVVLDKQFHPLPVNHEETCDKISINIIFTLKGYLISCVGNSYRHINGRNSSDVPIYITSNDDTVLLPPCDDATVNVAAKEPPPPYVFA
ncbi:hypothetical protein P7K49_016798 [Saguinus oedipus]|uniref:Lysosomal-associated transmembrane protein 4B n=1 Tax=Saguinus oedipus TaxID=9490 RepID=A0ABQ9VD42_SAGOE|nr:hypothetical protein P7K49_016798 [Saguinus oedipus]